MSGETRWTPLLPPDLLESARRANGELAWTELDALRVLDVLTASGWRVLGVDTWTFASPTTRSPTVLGPDWDVETWNMTADRFIAGFKDRADLPAHLSSGDILFNFTADRPA